MRARTAILASVAIAMAATTPSIAAVKKKPLKFCNLIVDVKGDGTTNLPPGGKSDALDIVSADVATGKTEFVAVLRVVTTNVSNDYLAHTTGFQWGLGANGSGTRYEFSVRRDLGPDQVATWRWTASIGDMNLNSKQFTGKIVGNTFEWRVPRKGIGALNRTKLFWTAFSANSKAMSSTADEGANNNGKYPDKALSCVLAK